MFFSLSKNQDLRFPNHTQIGSWILSHDDGWETTDTGLRKGYYHSDINYGNFAEFKLIDTGIALEHDLYRSFPLWWNSDSKTLTNLLGTGEPLWVDQNILVTNSDIQVTRSNVVGEVSADTITMHQATDRVATSLVTKFEAFKRDYSGVKPKFFLTGGIDTLLLLALADYTGLSYDYVNCEHLEYNSFLNANFAGIKGKHWAYRQMHHWNEPTWLLSGCPGDEYLFRGPATVATWCAWHDIDLVNKIQNLTGYHVGYYLKDKNVKLFTQEWNRRDELQSQFATKQAIVTQLLNVLANDHQHWHLGNTLTWSPYKDLEIVKTVMQLEQDDLFDHFVDARLNKEIIKKLSPERLEMLSDTKNSNPRSKLHKFGF